MSSLASQTNSAAVRSVEDYLHHEREGLTKHEYFKGEVREVGSASFAHNLIATNLTTIIGQHLRGSTSRLMVGSNQRIYIPGAQTFCYPDLGVIYDSPEYLDALTQDTLLNPALLVQIVTPTPEGAWGGRFNLYRQLPSLQQYVLLHAPSPYAEWYWRDKQGRWLLTDTNARPGVLDLSSIGCQVPLAEVYAGVAFEG